MFKRAIFDRPNILVTGGAGFIGSHLCDRLISTSKVICLDNFSTGAEINIDHLLADPNFEFIKHDITEPLDLEKLPELQKFKIEFQGIQEIYNLACPTSPKDFVKNKIPTILASSYGVKNMLDLAVRFKAKFMHFSSSVVYGPRQNDSLRVKEDDLGKVDFLSERSSYDEGKRFSETIVENYRQAYDLDAKVARLFRNEKSGELMGLTRIRQFTLSDAHVICRADQVEEEFVKVLEFIKYVMQTLNIEGLWYRFSKWDPQNKEKYIDEILFFRKLEDIYIPEYGGMKDSETGDENAPAEIERSDEDIV